MQPESPSVDFQELDALARSLREESSDPENRAKLDKIRRAIAALAAAELGDVERERGRDRIRQQFQDALTANGIGPGSRIAEVGGALNSFHRDMPDYRFTFLSMFPGGEGLDCIVADICHCPHIPDQTFDAIFSISVMEHVHRPWLAGKEMARILKPGGIVFHHVPFSYFFHGAPQDYWRYTTTGLASLFPGFETIRCEFDAPNRRRNNMGSATNPVDADGGKLFSADAFGGWRENWSTIYVGKKTAERKPGLDTQLLVDMMRAFTRHGLPEAEAADMTVQALRVIHVDDEGRLVRRRRNTPARIGRERVINLWRNKRRRGELPSHNQFILPSLFPLAPLIEELKALQTAG